MKKHSDEAGYTMLETIMYISIMIVLSISIMRYINTAFTRYKTGRVSQQVVDLKKAIMEFTAIDEDYRNLTLIDMADKRAIPYDLLKSYSKPQNNAPDTISYPKHALGGNVKLGCVRQKLEEEHKPSTSLQNNYMFYITFEGIPRESCIELLIQGQFYGGGTDMDSIIVNNSNLWQYQHSLYPKTGLTLMPLPENATGIDISVTQALDTCSRTLDNQITWIFS